MIDIRSDTVTKPTETMRKAMASAEVGDDVYGDDPTINELEAMGTELTGKEAALFVPSGTFGNQLALLTWCPRGSEVILGEESHIIQHEAGAPALIAGVQTRTIPAPEGRLDPDAVEERIRGVDIHFPSTSLICLENAHSSGRVVPLTNMAAIREVADRHQLPIHLDGARLFNAASALGISASEVACYADSVMFCLSKGLCAPIGSLLAGPRAFIDKARRNRKIMGGGMRQAGILGAAGLIALRDMTKRLSDDHLRAHKLAEGLAKIPGVHLDPLAVEINMVFFTVPRATDPALAERMVTQLRKRGIIANPPEKSTFRFVTHFWIGDEEVQAIIAACEEIFTED